MEIGSRVGPYEIRQLLGQGGMAQVWKAWHEGLHRFEALKVPAPRRAADGPGEWPGGEAAFVARFLHEARVAAGLRHPHIATIHAVSEAGAPRPFFAMELVEGGDLAALLRERGPLDPIEALLILEAIASAVDYAHGRGVVHRDIKPANVLLEVGFLGWVPKVVDFGIAHAAHAPDASDVLAGTPEYMSPEQARGEEAGPRSDIYSLGVVAFEMLCGRPPFALADVAGADPLSLLDRHAIEAPPRPSSWRPSLPPDVDNVLAWTLSKDPAHRPASAGEFVHALGSALDAADTMRALSAAVARPSVATSAPAASEVELDPPTLLRAPGVVSPAGGAMKPAHRRASRPWLAPAAVGVLCLGIVLAAATSRAPAPASTSEPPSTPGAPEPSATEPIAPTAAPSPTASPKALASAAPDRTRAEKIAQQARRVKLDAIDDLLLLRKRQERDLLRPDEAAQSRRRLLARLEEGLSLCEAALALDLGNQTAWEQKAALLFLAGRFEEAALVARRGLALFPASQDLEEARDKARDRLTRSRRVGA